MSMTHFMIVNESILPYNLDRDIIKLKITFMLNNRMSFKSGITGSVYGNVGMGGATTLLTSFTTNDYGVASVNIPTSIIPNPNINTCQLWVEGTYKGDSVNSVIARANFLYHPLVEELFITAGSCVTFPSDRSDYEIYDAGNLCGSGLISREVDFIIERGNC